MPPSYQNVSTDGRLGRRGMAPAHGARPRERDLRHVSAVADVVVADERVVVRPRLDELRNAEIEDAVRLPQAVVAHVAEAAGAVGVPAAVHGEGVARMVGTIGLGSLPERPVEAVGHGRPRLVIRLHALRPERTIGPVVHLADGADHAGRDPRRQRVPVGLVAVREQVGGGRGSRARPARYAAPRGARSRPACARSRPCPSGARRC